MTQPALPFEPASGPGPSLTPLLDLGAYEVLWSRPGASFRSIAKLFRQHPGALPSDLVEREEAEAMARTVLALLREGGVSRFGIRVHRAGEYPAKLRDARHPVELLYYQGSWSLVESPAVAVVGTREASEEGLAQTRELVRGLVEDGWTIASGLAAGVDTAAHQAALAAGGTTFAVLGTPLSVVYPRGNQLLQRRLAEEQLVISQVPVHRSSRQGWQENRSFFLERNVTMAALTAATIVVEARERSGTRTQSRAALEQGRKLFLLDGCFRDPAVRWPHAAVEAGALRVRDPEEIREALAAGEAWGADQPDR
jgi:DNA processing protein